MIPLAWWSTMCWHPSGHDVGIPYNAPCGHQALRCAIRFPDMLLLIGHDAICFWSPYHAGEASFLQPFEYTPRYCTT